MICSDVSHKGPQLKGAPTYLTPDVRRMLVHQRLRRVTVQQLGHDQEANIFLAVQCLLKDMAAVAVRR